MNNLVEIKKKYSFGRVMVLGSLGMVGSAICRAIKKSSGVTDLIASHRGVVDLRDKAATFEYIRSHNPDWVIIAAAKVGGILANKKFPTEFLLENLEIELNAIEGAFRSGVGNIIFLGSSCIYPRECKIPISENQLLSSYLESTNEPYALAKIAGLRLCKYYNEQHFTDYRALMPCNLYGYNDNYHPDNSHVIPGLISRIHHAKKKKQTVFSVWGTGLPRREFLFVDDLADAVISCMGVSKKRFYEGGARGAEHINVGAGYDISIRDLAYMIKSVTGFEGEILFDHSMPDGTMRKVLDITRIKTLGWSPSIPLETGLRLSYDQYQRDSVSR